MGHRNSNTASTELHGKGLVVGAPKMATKRTYYYVRFVILLTFRCDKHQSQILNLHRFKDTIENILPINQVIYKFN